MGNLVVTVYFTSTIDPQRGHVWAESQDGVRSALKTLKDSVQGFGQEFKVITDVDIDGEEFIYVPREPGANPYWRRWREISSYLDTRPDVEFVVGLDGTDTEMLGNPFPNMRVGSLYVGSEPTTIGGQPWMSATGPMFDHWQSRNSDRLLLNAGLVGSDKQTFQQLVSQWTLFEDLGAQTDMQAFQYLLYTQYEDCIVTGHPVHTRFKAYEKTSGAWFRHK